MIHSHFSLFYICLKKGELLSPTSLWYSSNDEVISHHLNPKSHSPVIPFLFLRKRLQRFERKIDFFPFWFSEEKKTSFCSYNLTPFCLTEFWQVSDLNIWDGFKFRTNGRWRDNLHHLSIREYCLERIWKGLL